MALGQYTPRPDSKGKTTTFKPQENVGKPLLAVPREFIPDFESDQYEGLRDVIIYDIVDLSTCMTAAGLDLNAAKIYPTVMTGAKAIRDDMKRFIPGGTDNPTADEQMMAVKIGKKHSNKSGFDFYVLDQLDGPELQLAAAWEQHLGLPKVLEARAAHAAANVDPAVAAAQDQVAALQAQLAAALAGQGAAAPAVAVAPAPAVAAAVPAAVNPASAFNDAALQAAIAKITAPAA